jgi:alpha-L-fucosidase
MAMNFFRKLITACLFLITGAATLYAQDIERWDKQAVEKENPNAKWFKAAKFGMFIHWGLYAKLGGIWKDKDYYGSGEWDHASG